MEENIQIVELINKALKNDEQAFTNLIHLIEPEMYRIAKIKLKSDDDAYEAMQKTVILIYKHLKKIKNKQLFRTWAMKILINESIKILNKQKSNIENNVQFIDENVVVYNKDFENIESKYDMERLIKYLNENEKIVITLYYGENFTTKEIANILSESEGTIKSRICRAKVKLKNYLEGRNLYE